MSTHESWKPRIAPGMRLQMEPTQNAWVLLYPEGMARLNPSASEVLRRCDGTLDVAAITAELEGLFEIRGILPQVQELVDEGARRGWIV
ncbi:pyrroloquinoline quinone biosynthesis peptide chaperone PqqD [Ramlibacter sp. 2FC]|uniref:pyrroloquinoline quinone biosynthesis peptide chaperone PqqD n=1 Tax=Ramlibacter sp. 2FC TaxID=2502188 RepID=UPI00201E05AA|nr:pyrroloquinoline quinone biosynthesis peptide chaperone PqqD [Ramlibacter sp. 2FC]